MQHSVLPAAAFDCGRTSLPSLCHWGVMSKLCLNHSIFFRPIMMAAPIIAMKARVAGKPGNPPRPSDENRIILGSVTLRVILFVDITHGV